MNDRKFLFLLLPLGLMLGCQTDPDRAMDAKFGDSVRHALALQTASPTAAGPGFDAVRARGVLRAYREVPSTLDLIMARNPPGAININK